MIELLVVIAIIGILSSVVLASLNSARTKAKTAAFKAEAAGLVAGLVSACDEATLTEANMPANPSTYELTGIFSGEPTAPQTAITQSCGTAGTGVWSFTIAPTNGADCTSATVTNAGVTFAGNCAAQ